MTKLWDTVDIAWLAGVLEGECCFSYKSSGSVVVVVRTDQDIIERLREPTGIGTINGPVAPQKSHHKPSWRWQVSQKQDVARLLLAVYPLMGERRKATIAKLTDRLAQEVVSSARDGTPKVQSV